MQDIRRRQDTTLSLASLAQRQIKLKDWSWNTKKQRTRENVDEMVDKDSNIWGPNAWPDLVTKHFVDL